MIIECIGTPPVKGSDGAAGYDLTTTDSAIIYPGESHKFNTGLHLHIPDGYVGIVKSRSGLSFKHYIECGAGVIDSDYRGAIKIHLYNHGQNRMHITAGDRIAQLLIHKVEEPIFKEVISLDQTERGSDGFGSTGI